MERAVKKGEVFATFKFNGKDSADMGIYNVTNGATYDMNMEAEFADQTKTAPAYDGKYYYGSQITSQKFTFNCFAHDLTITEYNKLRSWLSPRNIGPLILSDQVFKYYLVKPVSVSNLSAIPLSTIQTPSYSVLGDTLDGDPVYTGNFTVTFETVGSAYGYGMSYYRDDLIYDAAAKYGRDYYYNSGLIYKDMSPKMSWRIEPNAQKHPIPIYNPGSAEAQPVYEIEHEGTFADYSLIQLENEDTGTSVVINVGGGVGNLKVDTVSQSIEDSDGNVFYGRFSGPSFKISPFETVYELPETFVTDVEDTDLIEYDSLYIKDNVVSINPLVLKVDEDMVGMYFCCNCNGGSMIMSVNKEDNTLTLDDKVYTADILPGKAEGGVIIKPSGFAFNYIEVNNEMPVEGKEGNVCKVNDVWYRYVIIDTEGNGEWQETNLFDKVDDFKNIYGDYITQYRTFGATILKLDRVSVTTGSSLKFTESNIVHQGVDVGAFKLKAELQPRYL